LDSLRSTLAALADRPRIGRRRDELSPGLRGLPTERHIVFYRATTVDLLVRRILHQSRDTVAEFSP